MEEVTVKRGRGRPPKQHQKTPTGVVPTPSAPEFHMPNANNNNSVEGSPNGDIEMLESIVPGRSGRGRGRPRKHPLENGSASGFDKSISQENISGVDKDVKKMKSERSLESPLRRSSRYTLSSPHTLSDVIRQNAIADSVADDVKGSPFMNAVVKVFCVHTEPNFSLPWQRKRQFSSNSSGFIIDGRRVLTNAHSVEHHTQVKLKKRGSDTKYLATVLAIGTECDIGKHKIVSKL